MRKPQNLFHRRQNYPLEASEHKGILEETASTLLELRALILWTLEQHRANNISAAH